MEIKNEFGEEITEKQLREIGRRTSSLPEESIDEFFHRAGFIVSNYKGKERPEEHKALFPEQIKEIKDNKEESAMIKNLLTETKLETVLKTLEKIEKESK